MISKFSTVETVETVDRKTREVPREQRARAFGWDRSADHIRASSQNGCIQRPDTWLHPNASRKRQILLLHRGRRPYMALGVFHCGAQNFDAIGSTTDIDWPLAPIASEAYDPKLPIGTQICCPAQRSSRMVGCDPGLIKGHT
jgi:hypothetical protein